MQLTDRTSLLLQVFHPAERQRPLREGDLPVVQSLEGPQELRGPGGHYALQHMTIDCTIRLIPLLSNVIIHAVYCTLFYTTYIILYYYIG